MKSSSKKILVGSLVAAVLVFGFLAAWNLGVFKNEFQEWQERVRCVRGTAFAADTTWTCKLSNGCEAVRELPVLGDVSEYERCSPGASAETPPLPPPPKPSPAPAAKRPPEPKEPVERRAPAPRWTYQHDGVSITQGPETLIVAYRRRVTFDACSSSARDRRGQGPGYDQFRVVSVMGPYVGIEKASLFNWGETVPHESQLLFTFDARSGKRVAVPELFERDVVGSALLELLNRDAPYEASFVGANPTLEKVTEAAVRGHVMPELDAFVFQDDREGKVTLRVAKYQMSMTEEVPITLTAPAKLRAELDRGAREGFFGRDRKEGWTTCGHGPKKSWPKVSP